MFTLTIQVKERTCINKQLYQIATAVRETGFARPAMRHVAKYTLWVSLTRPNLPHYI